MRTTAAWRPAELLVEDQDVQVSENISIKLHRKHEHFLVDGGSDNHKQVKGLSGFSKPLKA